VTSGAECWMISSMNGDPISFWLSDGIAWIKPIGDTSEINSRKVKSFLKEAINRGVYNFVVDAGECTGMDEVFLGVLLGTALRLHELGRGKLQVLRCPPDLDAKLRNLGLDQLIAISTNESPESS
jgi:anti-anti-sigma regulatory factor